MHVRMSYESCLTKIDVLKAELDAQRPLSDVVVTQLREYYRIGLTYTSNAVEGNTLTESETKVVIEDGITIAGKSLKEHDEVRGHSAAFDVLYELSQQRNFAESDILQLHRVLYQRIDEKQAGAYRTSDVIITGTDYLPPTGVHVPQAMVSFARELDTLQGALHTVELAAHVHRELVMIHPFIDGNGRVARLLMNLVLLQGGFPIAVIPPVVRADYIAALVQVNKGNMQDFTNFISTMVYEALKDYARILEHHQR